MKNRHGVEYNFVKVSDNKYRFEMAEDDINYMRVGGKEGQEKIDMNDLGMFDPSGGPYVGIGSKVYWDEIHEGKKGSAPLIVKGIASTDEGIFVEVEWKSK